MDAKTARMTALSAIAGVSMLAFGAGHALAQANEDLAAYAALAKIEANLAEVGASVGMGMVVADNNEMLQQVQKEFEGDSKSIEAYVEELRGMKLAEDQKAALDKFEQEWKQLSQTAENLLSQGDITDEQRKQAFQWYQAMDKLDDEVDQQLLNILKKNNIQMAAAQTGQQETQQQ